MLLSVFEEVTSWVNSLGSVLVVVLPGRSIPSVTDLRTVCLSLTSRS